MPHIHQEPGQYDFTASAFIVRTDFEEPMIMLHWHKLLDKYMQFGGHVELHESLWQTVIHEVLEESGYHMNQLKLLQPPDRIRDAPEVVLHPQPIIINSHGGFKNLDHFHTDISYGFVTDQQPAQAVAEGENDQFAFFSLAQLKSGEGIIGSNIRAISIFLIEILLDSWERVNPAEFSAN